MSKARNLSDFISDPTISSTEIADLAVTHAKLHTTMDLSSKTVTLPTLSTLNTTGNVGIGTPSPASKLHIKTSTDFNYEFEEVSSKLRFSALNDARSANVPLQFAASEFNFISGNVGIGTSSPDAIFTVDTNVAGASTGTIARFHSSKGESDSTFLQIAATRHPTASVQRVQLQAFDDDGSTGRTLALNSSGGNVGIGTNSPNATLTVSQSANNIFAVERTGVASGSGQFGINVENNSQATISYDDGTQLVFGTASSPSIHTGFTERMRIDSSGNVEIATGQLKLANLSSDPASPVTGGIYYNTTLNQPRIYAAGSWMAIGANAGTVGNPFTSVAQAQASNAPLGLHYFTNGSGTAQQLYYDPNDSGWIMVASNNWASGVLPAANNRRNLAYTINRNGATGHLGSPDPDGDYLIGNFIDTFTINRIRCFGWGFNSVNGTYTWPSNLGNWHNTQWNVTAGYYTAVRNQVVPSSSVTKGSISGVGGTYAVDGSAAYFVIDGIYTDNQHGGFGANQNQTTIGAVGVSSSNGDPGNGCYMGHGGNVNEGNGEGWYSVSGGGAISGQGYTTWIR